MKRKGYSSAAALLLLKYGRRNKYGSRRTQYLGEWYASGAEAAHAYRLEMRKRAGEILMWTKGRTVVLIDGPTRSQSVTYTPDFDVVPEAGRRYVVDVKGSKASTPRDFRIKALLWAERFPDCPLVVVDRDGNEMDLFATKPRRKRIRVASPDFTASPDDLPKDWGR